MITSQDLSKISNFSDLTPQRQIKDHGDNSKSIYLPGTDCSLRTHTSLSGFTSYRVGGEAELVSAQVLSPDGTLVTLTPEELGYTYRSSRLQGGKWIVTQATLQLQPGADPVVVTDRTKDHKKHRLSTQPYSYPSCGSVFRNPQPYTAGWLIEQTGLKGYQLGGAQVAQLHANFIVNRGGAKASDIFSLIRHVQNEVQERWSIWLEPEVKMLGEFPAVC